jgi:hypothetical protein
MDRIMTVFRKKSSIRKLMGLLSMGAVLAPGVLAQAVDTIDFTISEGQVIPSEDFAVKVEVLGAAITSGGVDIPVTVQIKINGQFYEPFGQHDLPLDSNVNDGMNPREFIIQEVFNPSDRITVTGTSWVQKNNTDGEENNDYRLHLRRNSFVNPPYVKVLRHGDPVPDITGFDGQADAVEFVRDYIDPDTNTMVLGVNQSIYLYEIGTTQLTSGAADFQDLVVLVTLGTSPEALEEGDLADASYD